MPRIYYNPIDEAVQSGLFLVHAIIFVLGISWLWLMQGASLSFWLGLWTFCLTIHGVWQSPLHADLQFRTYDRLRNRFGRDWDLAATDAEYNHEQAIARLEAQHKRILPEASRVLVALGAVGMILFYALGSLPIQLAIVTSIGWGIASSLLWLFSQWRLSRMLRLSQLESRKKDNAKTQAIPERLVDANQRPRVGMTYAVGDDGELVEIPLAKHKPSERAS
ncbi:MAG: hypothetical protein AAFN11_14720 [Chloroflexota bacterium]